MDKANNTLIPSSKSVSLTVKQVSTLFTVTENAKETVQNFRNAKKNNGDVIWGISSNKQVSVRTDKKGKKAVEICQNFEHQVSGELRIEKNKMKTL